MAILWEEKEKKALFLDNWVWSVGTVLAQESSHKIKNKNYT